jgi:hypothetical protein
MKVPDELNILTIPKKVACLLKVLTTLLMPEGFPNNLLPIKCQLVNQIMVVNPHFFQTSLARSRTTPAATKSVPKMDTQKTSNEYRHTPNGMSDFTIVFPGLHTVAEPIASVSAMRKSHHYRIGCWDAVRMPIVHNMEV